MAVARKKKVYLRVGRPPEYSSPEDFATKATEYFESRPESKWTINGLALHLGFDNRQSLYDYEKREEFSGIVKQCRAVVEMAYEGKLSSKFVTGAIFALKNMGWSDKQEITHNSPMPVMWHEEKTYETKTEPNA